MIADYFQDTVTIVSRTRDGRNGAFTETSTSHAARAVAKTRMLNINGETKTSNYEIFLAKGTAVKVGDRIILTKVCGGAYANAGQYVVLQVNVAHGFGNSHVEVLA